MENDHPGGWGAASIVMSALAFTLRRTGDLWFASGLQAAWDWAGSFFMVSPTAGSAGFYRPPADPITPWFEMDHRWQHRPRGQPDNAAWKRVASAVGEGAIAVRLVHRALAET